MSENIQSTMHNKSYFTGPGVEKRNRHTTHHRTLYGIGIITMFYACCFRSAEKMRYALRRWNICTQLEKV